jgi:ATP-dependent RNA circularization protein (DNA/RNA ligase family)
MREYHKIDTVFKRDPDTKFKTLVIGDYSREEFGYLAGNDWVFTEKVDGTNIRVIVHDDAVSFGGKTDNAQLPAFLVRRLEELFMPQLAVLVETFPDGGCLYGEGYGAKIQKGGANYRADQDFVLFDVKVGEWWLQRETVQDIGAKFGINVVPIIGCGALKEMVAMVQCGFNSTWGEFVAEGVVARPAVELKGRDGKRIITKLKHRDFGEAA